MERIDKERYIPSPIPPISNNIPLSYSLSPTTLSRLPVASLLSLPFLSINTNQILIFYLPLSHFLLCGEWRDILFY